MKLAKLLPCLVLLVCSSTVHNRVYNRHKKAIVLADELRDENTAIAFHDLTSNDLHKRSVGGLILTITMTSLTLASSGLQIWTAVAEGCNLYPSICKNRDEIKRLEGVLAEQSKQYDKVYYANQWKYLNLKTSMIDNQYILHFINSTLSKVNDIGSIIDKITTRLEVDLKTMEKMFASGNNSATIESLVGPLDFQLKQIEKMLRDSQQSQIIGLLIQRGAEVFIHNSILYIDGVISKAKGHNLDAGDSIVNRLSGSNAAIPPTKRTFWQKTKNYFATKAKSIDFAFKAVGADIKQKFGTTLPNNVKKWWKSEAKFKTFQTKVRNSILKKVSTINKVKNFFKHPKASAKYAVKNFKFKPGQAFVEGVGLVVEGIMTYAETKQWEKVAEEITKARKEYENYHAKVSEALEEVNNETKILDVYWSDTIDSFKDLVVNFNNITTEANKNKVFAEFFGLTGLPVDTKDKFFHTNFAVVNEEDLRIKQQIVINFFNANGKQFSALRDKFMVQKILVTETQGLVSKNKEINFILNRLQTIYKNLNSEVMKRYSSKLVEKDVVCACSIILPNKKIYDYYPLDVFRDAKCSISNAQFLKMKHEARVKKDKRIFDITVKKSVPLKKQPAAILDLAKAGYASSKQAHLRDFGSKLTEQDVVCVIATIFTDMDNYLFYDLTAFRPDCTRVIAAKFKQMQDIVKKTENARKGINVSMQFCVFDAKQCNCPTKLANMLGISVKQTNLLIEEYKQKHKPTCNHVENSGKCQWQC